MSPEKFYSVFPLPDLSSQFPLNAETKLFIILSIFLSVKVLSSLSVKEQRTTFIVLVTRIIYIKQIHIP